MKKFGWMLLLVWLQLPGMLFAQNFNELLVKADHYFSESKYDSALICYQEVLAQGYHASEIYYNIGNSYYKQNNMPSAILYYEKALKLDPSNEDVLFNLKLANARIPDKIDPLPQLFFKRWYIGLYNMFSVDNGAKIALILFAAFALFSLFYFLGKRLIIRKIGFYLALFFLLTSLAGLFLTYQKSASEKQQNLAIVFTPSVTVKSSPNANGIDLFVIHEGTKVQVVDKVGAWCEIKIANGSVGWIELKTIELI